MMQKLFLNAIQTADQEALKMLAKIIAHVVRDEIEDFHVKYLSQDQMKELNPLVRRGIYNALFAFSNYETDPFSRWLVNEHISSVPDYWENPELYPAFKDALLSANAPAEFQSLFLSEQYRIGNLSYNSRKRCIEIKPSFDLEGVEGDKRRHLNKITAQLRKEGYRFNPALQGYQKEL